DPGPEVMGAFDVRVQARDPDLEPSGERRDGHLLEADLVGQLRSRPGQTLRGQPCACHTRPLLQHPRQRTLTAENLKVVGRECQLLALWLKRTGIPPAAP